MIRPDYYANGGVQPVEVWGAWNLDAYRSTAIKYICRAGSKPGQSKTKDLEKAATFLILLAESHADWEVWTRDEEKSLIPEPLRYNSLVKAWSLEPPLNEALGALLFARSAFDLKVAAFHLNPRKENSDA